MKGQIGGEYCMHGPPLLIVDRQTQGTGSPWRHRSVHKRAKNGKWVYCFDMPINASTCKWSLILSKVTERRYRLPWKPWHEHATCRLTAC